jgi:hypothetical protein
MEIPERLHLHANLKPMKILFTILFTLALSNTFAQERNVTGRLTDRNGDGLPGVNIVVKGTTNGTVTDFDGNYSINAPIGSTLVFSFIGLQTREMIVTEKNLKAVGKMNSPDVKQVAKISRKIKTPIAQKSWPAAILADTAKAGDGVAILNDKSPTYSHSENYLNGNTIVAIKPKIIRGISRSGFVVLTNTEPKRTGFSLQFVNSYNLESAGRLPKLQNTYVQGRSSDLGLQWIGPDQNEIFSWGPSYKSVSYDGGQYAYDQNGRLQSNLTGRKFQRYDSRNFFRSGNGYGSDLLLSVPGLKRSTITLNVRRKIQSGVIPNSNQDNNDFSFSVRDIHFSDRFKVTASAGYHNSKGRLMNHGANLSSIFASVLRTPISFDNSNGFASRMNVPLEGYRLADGSKRSHAPNVVDNPYGLISELPDHDRLKRYLANATAKFDITDKLMVSSFSSVDKQSNRSVFGIAPQSGSSTDGRLTWRADEQSLIQSNLISEYHSWLDEGHLKVTLNYSFASEKRDLQRFDAFGIPYQTWHSRDVDSDFFSQRRRQVRNTSELFYRVQYNHDWLTVRAGNRSYYSNTISKSKYSNVFPSATAIINIGELANVYPIDLLKIYSSVSRSIREAPLVYPKWAHLTTSTSAENYSQFYESSELFFRPGLSPETEKKFEAGIESHVSYRFNFNAEYFKNYTNDLIVPIQNGPGFELANVANVRNTGGSITLGYNNYYHHKFFWTVSCRWSKYNSTVETVNSPNGNPIAIAGFSNAALVLAEHKPFGSIYGSSFLRDENGNVIIGHSGFPLVDPVLKIIGNSIPDWNLSMDALLKFKTLKLSVVFDYRRGGDVWNGTRAALDFLGRSFATGENRDITSYVFDGVAPDGQINQTPVNFYDPTKSIAQNRWVRYGFSGVGESYIEDGSFLRLSELAFSYVAPIKSNKIRELKFSLIGRNLFLITNYDGVDPSSTLFGYSTGAGLDMFNLPTTRSLSAQVSIKI